MKYIGQHIFDYVASFRQKVGIGTDTPDSLLEITSSSATDFLKLTSTSGSANPIKLIFEKSSTEQGIIEYNRNGDFEIYNNDSDGGVMIDGSASAGADFYVANSGNVGIGTASPSQKLEVSGNALASNLISSGYVKLGADNQILSDGSITIDIDYNNNQTDRFFKVRKDNSTDLFTISEDASASFVGDVTITKSDPTLILEDTSGTDNQARIWLRESASYGVQLEYQSDVSDFFQISMIDANVGNTNPIPALTINRNTNATFANDVTVTGNLTVSGTTTTIDTTNLNVEDKNITINYSTGDSSSTADGAGITIQDAVDSSTNATLLWNATQDRFNFSHAVQLPDSTLLYLGSDSDMNVQHTGSDGFIMNDTGHLYIRNRADDKDIIFQTDDGSGSVTEYFRVDGSSEKTFYSKPILLFDSVALQLGTGTDATLYHSGGEGNLQNFTGNFRIIQGADDSDIQFFCDDGSGGVTEYFRLDGGTERIRVSKNLRLSDSVELQLGNVSDLTLAHDGTNSEIANNTGDLTIKNRADDKDIIFQSDDGSGGVATYFYLDGSVGFNRFPYPVIVEDSVNFNLGTGQDMQLLHNGSDSVIRNATGDLYIQQNVDDGDIIFQSDDGSGGTTEYFRLDGSAVTVEVSKPINLASASSSASSGIYAQFINLKGFCTLAANYQFAEDLEDTKSPFEMALDYGSATISSSTEVNQSNLFRAAAFHVPVACSVNAINMQLTCNNAGNVTIAVVEYRPSEAGTDQVDHPKTIYEEVVVASNNNNNKVKTVTVATADLDNTAIPAGSHIMIMAKGDDQTIGGKAFISAAIEIKW